GGERAGSALVRVGHGIVRDRTVLPLCVRGGIAMDAELRHEAADHPEKADVVVVATRDELIEPIDTVWRPGAIGLEHERSLVRLEADAKRIRRLLRDDGFLGGWRRRLRATRLAIAGREEPERCEKEER